MQLKDNYSRKRLGGSRVIGCLLCKIAGIARAYAGIGRPDNGIYYFILQKDVLRLQVQQWHQQYKRITFLVYATNVCYPCALVLLAPMIVQMLLARHICSPSSIQVTITSSYTLSVYIPCFL